MQFEVDIPCSTNLRLMVPIIIGTEPFIFLPEPPWKHQKEGAEAGNEQEATQKDKQKDKEGDKDKRKDSKDAEKDKRKASLDPNKDKRKSSVKTDANPDGKTPDGDNQKDGKDPENKDGDKDKDAGDKDKDKRKDTKEKEPEDLLDEKKIQVEILDMGQNKAFVIPRFHPLNKNFQKRFPETFGKNRDDRFGRRKKAQGSKAQCNCDCGKEAKKRHRSVCKKMIENAKRAKKYGQGEKTRRVKTYFGNGMPLEECTYNNWLSACIDDVVDEDGRQTNILWNVMKQYGLLT